MGHDVPVGIFDGEGVGVAVRVGCFCFVFVGKTIGTLVFVAWMGIGNVGVIVGVDVTINNGDSVKVGEIVGS
jgi:hypothetical protein